MKHLSPLVIFLLGATCFSAANEQPPALPFTKKAPTIDGRMDRAEWRDAWYSGAFKVRDGNPLPITEGWVQMDASTLYFAFRCEEPQPDAIRVTTLPYEDHQPVWQDDSVEIYLDIENAQKNLFRLVVNSEATIFGARILNLQQMPIPWASGAVAKATRSNTAWEVEVAIPMAALGHALQPGEVFSVNLARTRFAQGAPQYGSLIHNGQFLFPELNQRLLAGGPITRGNVSLISLRRGPFLKGQSGSWEFQAETRKGHHAALISEVGGERKTVPLTPGRQTFSTPIPAGQERAFRLYRLNLDREAIYHSEYRLEEAEIPAQVATTKEPLFDELIEAAPNGLSRSGTIIWGHEFSGPPSSWALALRTGTAGSTSHAMREFQKDNAIVMSTGHHDEPRWQPLFEKAGVKLVMDARVKQVPGVPGAPSQAWGGDPRVERAVIEKAKAIIHRAKENPAIWGIAAGDESWEHDESRLRYLLRNPDKRYPEVQAIDREIREKYGFGKYGFPQSPDDPNPFAWIATRRWVIGRMMHVQREIRKIVDAECPRLKIISWDNYPGHYPRNLHEWGPIFDIITGQLYPSRDSQMDEFGFVTKWLTDLSGSKEVWPCPHIEHYGGNFRPDEVEELLSQTFRAGATGLHLYASDTIGRRRGNGSFNVDRIGAPERWNAVRSVLERLKTPFRVKQPLPDAAIFYSNTSYQGQAPLRKTGEVEYLYTLLGPRLHGAFRFVDETIAALPVEQLLQYKAIYIPYAPIVDNEEYEALLSYVRAGGHLIVCDPLAFRHRSDGTERGSDEQLSRLNSIEPLGALPILAAGEDKANRLMAMSTAYPIKQGGKQLATYPDGSPAIVQTELGKGSVIWFGENPLGPAVVQNKEWIGLFSTLQRNAEISMGHQVWRFRFPKTEPYQNSPPGGLCLTGNFFEWRHSSPVPLLNSSLPGSYTLSHEDDHASEPINRPIALDSGRLTDRIRGANADNQEPLARHSLTWTRDAKFHITFAFEQPVQPTLLRLYFSGRLPEGICESSDDGTTWSPAGTWKERSSAEEVLPWSDRTTAERHSVAEEAIKLPSAAARYFRLSFHPKERQRFTLAECDIWGTHPSSKP